MGLKYEGRHGPLIHVLFYPVFYPFGGIIVVKRVVIEVVFQGVGENWGYYPIFVCPFGVGSDDQRDRPRSWHESTGRLV